MLISASIDEVAERSVKLFGDPLRAEIVGCLAAEQLCTCHLVELTGARQPTVSHHLKVLRDAGLVEAIPEGRFTYYRLLASELARLRDGLDHLAASAATAPRRRACE
jgi:ArsR family transcriptional regulator